MRRNERPIIADFHPDEYLYRRVPTSLWPSADAPLTVDAMKLPDISMARSSLGHPEWLRLDIRAGIYRKNWGIIGIRCGRIPENFRPSSGSLFTYRVEHVPLDEDYPHSEIQAFDGETHLDTKESVLPEDLHLEWRANLLEVCNAIIRPNEPRAIRQDPPKSHEPELP